MIIMGGEKIMSKTIITPPECNIPKEAKKELIDKVVQFLQNILDKANDTPIINIDEIGLEDSPINELIENLTSICKKHDIDDKQSITFYMSRYLKFIYHENGVFYHYSDLDGYILKSILIYKFRRMLEHDYQEVMVKIPAKHDYQRYNTIIFKCAGENPHYLLLREESEMITDDNMVQVLEEAKREVIMNFMKEELISGDCSSPMPKYVFGEPGKYIYNRMSKIAEAEQKAKKEAKEKEQQHEREREQSRIRKAEKAKRKAEAKEKNKIERLFRQQQIAKSKKG